MNISHLLSLKLFFSLLKIFPSISACLLPGDGDILYTTPYMISFFLGSIKSICISSYHNDVGGFERVKHLQFKSVTHTPPPYSLLYSLFVLVLGVLFYLNYIKYLHFYNQFYWLCSYSIFFLYSFADIYVMIKSLYSSKRSL